MHRTRRLVTLFLSAMVAMAVTLVAVTPAHAAPGRSDSESTVIFIHGYAPTGEHDCGSYFQKAWRYFKNKNWDGRLHTYGYYNGNTNCSYNYKKDRNTSLNTVAKRFANRIHNLYSSKGKKVDIVAHSMGGLVVRTMLRHVALKSGKDGWPRYLYIEDVVTLGTPHDGTNWAEACDKYRQCRQMEKGSHFIKGLGEALYQSHMGTDWTLVSSFADSVVGEGSGVGARAQHKIQYRNLPGFDHNTLNTEHRGWHTGRAKHSSSWSSYRDLKSPLERARIAAYKHSTR